MSDERISDDHQSGFGEGETPEIEYPCEWEYRVVGRSVEMLEGAIREVLDELRHAIAPGNASAQGNWHSMSVRVQVTSDEHRRGLHERLRAHPDVRVVL